jgi:NodT family efflux transporter outer membrane factor (OMF) lipoprotein
LKYLCSVVNFAMRQITFVLVLALIVTGCAVGPKFHAPKAPDITEYVRNQPGKTSAPGSRVQILSQGDDISAQWWELFHSKTLNALIKNALANSPTLASAQAALRNARELRRAQAGALYSPAVDAGVSVNREKFSGASIGIPTLGTTVFTLYDASVNVSYVFDVFGGSRRQVESLRSLEEYQEFQLKAAYLSLTGNIVTTAMREASLRAQIRATREILSVQEKQLKVVERRYAVGAAAVPEVLSQKTLLAQARASLPQLEKSLETTRHQLAVLAGALPDKTPDIPAFEIEQFTLPGELPISVPSLLVRHRPDVLAQEALLRQAGAQIGVATANMLPKISLTGNYGWQSDTTDNLFRDETNTWTYDGGLQQPVYHGGELTARLRAARAAYDEADAQYRQTVLLAFENVADALRALEKDSASLAAESDARESSVQALDVTQKQFELGAVSYPLLLSAQQQYQQTYINFVQAEAALYADTAALFQALGGGWWNRQN